MGSADRKARLFLIANRSTTRACDTTHDITQAVQYIATTTRCIFQPLVFLSIPWVNSTFFYLIKNRVSALYAAETIRIEYGKPAKNLGERKWQNYK